VEVKSKKAGKTACRLKQSTASNAGPTGDAGASSSTTGCLSMTPTCALIITAGFISVGASSGNWCGRLDSRAGAWTPTELDTLDKLLGKVSASTIAKRLNRTETSVAMKIKSLNFSRRVREGYTMRDLELCLGADHHKIQKWIDNGLLRDRLQGTNRHDGNGHDIHRFREKDVLEFIKRCPAEISLSRVDSTWFLDLVLLKGREMDHKVQQGSWVESDEDRTEEVGGKESDDVDSGCDPQRGAADAASRIAGRGTTLKGAGIPVGFESR
jgi:hypothetical protein